MLQLFRRNRSERALHHLVKDASAGRPLKPGVDVFLGGATGDMALGRGERLMTRALQLPSDCEMRGALAHAVVDNLVGRSERVSNGLAVAEFVNYEHTVEAISKQRGLSLPVLLRAGPTAKLKSCLAAGCVRPRLALLLARRLSDGHLKLAAGPECARVLRFTAGFGETNYFKLPEQAVMPARRVNSRQRGELQEFLLTVFPKVEETLAPLTGPQRDAIRERYLLAIADTVSELERMQIMQFCRMAEVAHILKVVTQAVSEVADDLNRIARVQAGSTTALGS